MLLREDTKIYQNFDLSIIIIVDRGSLNAFKNSILKKINYLQRNGIEIIIIIFGKGVINPVRLFVMDYPFVNWKIIYSYKSLNISEALNIGVNNASKKYILTLHNSIEFRSDVIYKLCLAANYYNDFFIIDSLSLSTTNISIKLKNPIYKELEIFGCMLIQKEYVLRLRGFSEKIGSWIESHNNLFARLEMDGIKKLHLTNAISYSSLNHDISYSYDNGWQSKELNYRKTKEILFPNSIYANDADRNIAKIRFIYNWGNNIYSYRLCRKYLGSFINFWIKAQNSFKIKYKVIALVPTYNERKNINGLIKNIEKHCDGIIILDDSSDDGTFENIKSSKLLLKVQKKRIEFNDLENRNILLNLASFFNSIWFLFIDADERFDKRFSNINSFAIKNDIDSVWFKIVELWDNKNFCRNDLPIGINENGMFRERLRMFRNQGRMQLLHTRKLHFYTVPYKGTSVKSNILLHHYGTLHKKDRLKKYNTYLKEDSRFKENACMYEYLLDKKVSLRPISSLKL